MISAASTVSSGASQRPEARRIDPAPVNILFVNYGDFTTASLNHIGIFADQLCARGHDCMVAVPCGKETLSVMAGARFRAGLFDEILARPACFADGRTADILHAWTPRECIRKFAVAYQKSVPEPAQLLIHLEDNEKLLISLYAGEPIEKLRTMGVQELQRVVHPHLPHPVYCHSFLFFADAITHLTEPLRDLAPATVRTQLLPPGLDPVYLKPLPPNPGLRLRLGIRDGEKVIAYTGSNTFANEPAIRELYHAVGLLNTRGTPTRLLRTGITKPEFFQGMPRDVQAQVTELGFIPKASLPGILALADVLVQPGHPGPFDDYRLPSKLPEFLASGRPVILPKANIALLMQDGKEALFLRDGDALSIAERCESVFGDPALAARLGATGAEFARRYFDPAARTDELLGLYVSLVAQPSPALWRQIPFDSTTDLSATAGILAAALKRLENATTQPLLDLASLADDLACLSRLEEETGAQLRSEAGALRDQLAAVLGNARRLTDQNDGLREQLGVVDRHNRALEEARDFLAQKTQELGAAEQQARRELAQAWGEHARVSARVTELHGELGDREAKLAAMKNSFSWKITTPLRALQRLLR